MMEKSEELLRITEIINGNRNDFDLLVNPYINPIKRHCYRMVGSIQDAEDLTQNVFIKVWERLNSFEGRSSFKNWVYKIATNMCLDFLRDKKRKNLPYYISDASTPGLQIPQVNKESVYIEPWPDDVDFAQESSYEKEEAIKLEFISSLQSLSPRQRVAFLMFDVLDWNAEEISDLLGTSLPAVYSLLTRARRSIKARRVEGDSVLSNGFMDSKVENILNDYITAWQSSDLDLFMSTISEDVKFAMPPFELWFEGRENIIKFIEGSGIMDSKNPNQWQLKKTSANSQPAFAVYQFDNNSNSYMAFSIMVISINDNGINEINNFINPSLFGLFKLPVSL